MRSRLGLRATDLALCVIPFLVAAQVAAGDLAYVTNQNSSDLSILDLDARTEIARIPIPGKPAGITLDDKVIYTVSPDSKTVRKLSRTGEIQAETVLDGGPIGVALDKMRGRLFVTDWYNARLWVLDAATLETQQSLTTGSAPAGVALSPDGAWLVSADRDADQITIFDAETLAAHASVTVGLRPFAVTFGPDGRIFTADVGSDSLTVVDPATAKILATIPTGARPYGVAFAGGKGFVSNQYADTVTVFDLATLTPSDLIDVGEYPEGIGATTDGSVIVVANWFSNSVSLIDSTSHEIIGEIATGDGPRAFGTFIAAASP